MISVNNENIQFAANITHDLRNPLAGIKITAQVLKQHAHSSDDERLLQNIVNTTTHLSNIIDNILTMSKESSKEEAIYSFSLRELVTDVMQIVTLSVEAKKLGFYVDLSKDIIITGDRYRCFRILLNLVENAIKYTHRGHISLRYSLENNLVTVEIEDTGIGMTKKQQADIFKCYTQLESGSLASSGVGLGLHLVQLFTEQMGGKITVKSKIKKGSIFCFSLPYLTDSAQNTI